MHVSYLETPLGWLKLESTEEALTRVERVRSKPKNLKATRKPQILKDSEKQLKEYFAGKRSNFDLKLNPQGTDFQKKVWKALTRIPYGKTLSYKEVAEKIKKPLAARAVGMANNKNPIPFIVPCHRVIGANGKLVGYASGLNQKKWLLDLES